MRRMLKTTNATPQKRSGEGVSISGRRAFRRIESPPHSAIHIYVRNDIEKITKASVISRKITSDKPVAKKRFRPLLKRHLHKRRTEHSTRRQDLASIAAVFARHGNAPPLRLRQSGCLMICKLRS